MPLPALIQRLLRRPADVSAAGDADGGAGEAARTPPDAVAAARTLARRRLIGASVLLALAVGVFSLVFESRPRPLPLDTPIELAGRAPGVPAGGGAAVKPVTPLPAAATPASAASAPGPQALPAPAEPVAEAPAATPALAAPKEPVPARAASAPVAPKTAAAAPPPVAAPAQAAASRPVAAEGRFVVQVGAFAEPAQVRELRARLDKLGLRKHYVQTIEAKGGQRVNRVRLGPYGTRDEAERAAGRLKDAGLPGQVLEL